METAYGLAPVLVVNGLVLVFVLALVMGIRVTERRR